MGHCVLVPSQSTASVIQSVIADPIFVSFDSYCVFRVPNSVGTTITATTTATTNWRRVVELPTIEQLNLQTTPSGIEEWVKRLELWCSIRKGGEQN
ncbi:unnamed protein product [Echinostoma caproni]|uniref:Uncharacterized protein n=1 Tax=Echinostoma caproni TaxID=27848 RepID=A0A183AV02_9TREM|nr:unnamed protein product [Echinostoma caproni]